MTASSTDPTERFTGRAADYARGRPSYPREVVTLMRQDMGLEPRHIMADVGSGTGILSRLFVDCGNTVFGVEPNAAMRAAAEVALAGFIRFHGIEGRAEATNLPDRSVDFIVVGQAFHWFDAAPTREEFQRILKPAGWVVIVWNERLTSGMPFLDAYEAFLQCWGSDYQEVRQRYALAPKLDLLFGAGRYEHRWFEYVQDLDQDGFRGRLLSSSYVPGPDDPQRRPMLIALDHLFEEFGHDGRVRLAYDSHVYYGQLPR